MADLRAVNYRKDLQDSYLNYRQQFFPATAEYFQQLVPPRVSRRQSGP